MSKVVSYNKFRFCERKLSPMEQAFRVLNIYDKLLKNETVNKLELATEFNVNPRTIQRDIDNIRHYLYESTLHSDLELQIQFEQSKNSYFIKRSPKYSHQDDLRVQVTYEVTFKLYETLKIRDDIKILNKNDKTYDVQMNLNPNEAIDLCFQYHRSLRLISPDHLLKILLRSCYYEKIQTFPHHNELSNIHFFTDRM